MTGRARQYDYRALKDEYIAHDTMSVRELAIAHHVPVSSVSAVQRIAREEGWAELRERRIAESDDKTVDLISSKEAQRRVRQLEVADNALETINEALSKLRVDMQATKKVQDPETKEFVLEPAVRYRPGDVVALIDRIQGLFGETAPAETQPNESRVFGLSANLDGSDPAQLAVIAGLAGLARGNARPSEPRRVGESPLPSSPGPRPD